MRIDNTRMTSPARVRRGLALLIATGAGLGALLGTVPAHANDTVKDVAANGQSVAFTTSDSSRGVSGSVTFTVWQSGNWHISGTGDNSHLIGRNFRWICDLSWDASSVGHSTGKKWAPGKKTRTVSASAYDPFIQADFAAVVEYGRADCDIVIG
jgi:hypothetical protein